MHAATQTDLAAQTEGRARVMHRALGRCEIQVDPDCRPTQPEWHHRQRRGNHDHRASNSLAACRPCHTWIHANPDDSRRHGWILSALTDADPSTQPVWIRQHGQGAARWVHLSHGGTYQ